MKAVIGNGFFFFIICLLTIVFAHSRQNGSDQTIKLGTELVVLDATVLNKKTGLVLGGVKKEDFILYEDGVKQQITHFSQDELPLSIVLLLDVSCSVGSVFYQIQNGSLQALQRLKPEDEVALMAFDTEAAIIQSFTKDRRLIAERIMNKDEMMSILNNHRQVTPDGTHISDSIYQAAHYLGKASNPSIRSADYYSSNG
jgi:VWFA-related protein